MSSGEKAAEQTKGFVKGVGDVTESLRKNVNSFADDMIGSKSNTHSNAADGTHASTGFSNDAQKAGEAVRESVNQASGTSHSNATTRP